MLDAQYTLLVLFLLADFLLEIALPLLALVRIIEKMLPIGERSSSVAQRKVFCARGLRQALDIEAAQAQSKSGYFYRILLLVIPCTIICHFRYHRPHFRFVTAHYDAIAKVMLFLAARESCR